MQTNMPALPMTPAYPLPPSMPEWNRWEHTRLRRRLLDGTWKEDLDQRAVEKVGPTRRKAWGPLDQSANAFRVINRELAVLYMSAPDVRHADPRAAAFVGEKGLLAASGLWSQMPRYQAWVIGCRQYLMRPHVTKAGTLVHRPVPPDLVVAKSSEDDPLRPVGIREARLRADTEHPGAVVWCWDEVSIEDPDNPSYRVLLPVEDGMVDVTARYLGADRSWSGKDYPYRKRDRTPVLPYVVHHAERLGDRLWDAFDNIELVEGSLNTAVDWSLWGHALLDASWPQRHGINVRPLGAEIVEGEDGESQRGNRAEMITDPATVALFESIDESKVASLGQWAAGCDVEAMERAISAAANRMALDAGIPPGDIQRMGGTARSGYAISLSNEGKRVAQRRFAPQFRPSDEELVTLDAILLNRFAGANLPEEDYSAVYRELPLSPDELAARRTHVLELRRERLISRPRAYMDINPGISEAQAKADLAAIDNEGVAAAEAGTSPTAPAQPGGPVDAGADVAKAADTALNGAQIEAAAKIVERVARRELPREAGVSQLVEFFNLDTARAERIMGAVGTTFFIEAAPVAPASPFPTP